MTASVAELVYTMLDEPGYSEVVAVNTGVRVLPWWVLLGVQLYTFSAIQSKITWLVENHKLLVEKF